MRLCMFRFTVDWKFVCLDRVDGAFGRAHPSGFPVPGKPEAAVVGPRLEWAVAGPFWRVVATVFPKS